MENTQHGAIVYIIDRFNLNNAWSLKFVQVTYESKEKELKLNVPALHFPMTSRRKNFYEFYIIDSEDTFIDKESELAGLENKHVLEDVFIGKESELVSSEIEQEVFEKK